MSLKSTEKPARKTAANKSSKAAHGGILPTIAATGVGAATAGQKIRGIDGQVYYGVGSGGEGLLANLKSYSISITSEEIKANDRSSGAWGDSMNGYLNWTADIAGNLIQNSPDYAALYGAMFGSSNLNFSFRPQDITAGMAHTGTGVLSSIKLDSPESGVTSFTAQVRGRGALLLGAVVAGGAA